MNALLMFETLHLWYLVAIVPEYFAKIGVEKCLNHLLEAWEIHKFSSEVGPMEPVLTSDSGDNVRMLFKFKLLINFSLLPSYQSVGEWSRG